MASLGWECAEVFVAEEAPGEALAEVDPSDGEELALEVEVICQEEGEGALVVVEVVDEHEDQHGLH